MFEQTELFVRGIGEATDVVSKEMFTAISGENFKRRCVEGGRPSKAKSRLSLRPEGTAGVVRAVVQHDLVPQGAAPAKLMYAGPMFRAERPQKGRQRHVQPGGHRVPGRGGAQRSTPRPSSCSCASTTPVGVPTRCHAPAGELHGLRAVPPGLPRGSCARTWTRMPSEHVRRPA